MTSLTAFSTRELPVDERLARWEQHNVEQLIGLACSTLDGADLDATEVTRALPTVQLGRVRGTAHVVERSSVAVAAHPADAVMLYLVLSGDGFFHHPGGAFMVGPGNLLICDADRPFMRGFSSGLSELVIKVPRSVAREMTGSADIAEPRMLDFGTGATSDLRASALARIVADALRSNTSDQAPDGSDTDDAVLVDLVAAVLGAGSGSDNAVWSEIEVFVARHAHDPLLAAADIASAINVSTRQVSRLFAAHGSTVSDYVLRRRLDRAHRVLRAQARSNTTIAQIAAESGFASPSYFSRTFKAAYGATPAEVRRATR